MLRAVSRRANAAFVAIARQQLRQPAAVTCVRYSSAGPAESDDAFDKRYEGYFNDPKIDGWGIRKHINDMQGMDLVPEPTIIKAALKACRRVDDFALAIRYLESVKLKSDQSNKDIWPYIKQELTTTLQELGVNTPEEMGYDKPELWLQSVHDIH